MQKEKPQAIPGESIYQGIQRKELRKDFVVKYWLTYEQTKW